MSTTKLRYEVYGVDRAGTPWTEGLYSELRTALAVRDMLRLKAGEGLSRRLYGVWDTDDYERGDIYEDEGNDE